MKIQTTTPALGTRKQMNAALNTTIGGYFAQTTYCMERMKQVRLFVFPDSKVAIEVSNEAYNDFSALCRQSRPLIGAIPCNWMTAGATR
jgi:hypothetical protein